MPYTYPYPRPALTVDIALLRPGAGGPEVLLIRRGHVPFAGCWALPGGFVDEGEPLKAAACRELQEETGVTGVTLRQLAAFGDPGRDPRGWTVSVVFWTWLAEGEFAVQAGDDAAAVGWWPLSALPPLAFDHDRILVAVGRAVDKCDPGRPTPDQSLCDGQTISG